MNKIIEWFQTNPQTNLGILSLSIALGSAVFGGLFSIILWPSVKIGLARAWRLGQDWLARHSYQN